jgi:UDP-glucuronate decarboxylase
VTTATLRFSDRVATRLVDSELGVVVTGGGGWLGQATLEMLDGALGPKLASKVQVFGSSSRRMALRSGRSIAVEPMGQLANRDRARHTAQLVAHYAFVTREHAGTQSLSAYMDTNRAISDVAVDLAAREETVGVFVPSSGAVYGPDRTVEEELDANPYGALKLIDERRFSRLAGGPTNRRVVVSRVFNLAGPFLNKPDLYALGTILTDIARGGPVRIRAARPVIRSYVHVQDLVELAFAAMLGLVPVPDRPFDTAGEIEVELAQLAELAAVVLGRPEMPVERPPLTEAAADRYVGDRTTLARMAAEHELALRTLTTQIEDTADYLARPVRPA